jgi:hypothetical protein
MADASVRKRELRKLKLASKATLFWAKRAISWSESTVLPSTAGWVGVR